MFPPFGGCESRCCEHRCASLHGDTCLQFFGGLNQTVVTSSYGWVLRLFPFLFCRCRQTAISILAISVPWASHFMSPCICFSTCNMGLIILPTSEDCGRIKCGNCNKDLEWGPDTVSAQLTFILLGSLQVLCYSVPSRVSAFETPESGGHWLMEHGVTGRRKHGGRRGNAGQYFTGVTQASAATRGMARTRKQSHTLPCALG